jgi:hypothetical protein
MNGAKMCQSRIDPAPLFSPEIDFRAVRGSTHTRHPKNLPMKALIRAIQGESMSLSTLEALAKWRNVRLVKVLEMYGEEIPEDRRAEWELGLLLDRRPELRDVLEAGRRCFG